TGEVVFGQFCVPLGEERRPTLGPSGRLALGVRPESFEDAAFASPGLPTIEVEVAVLEELGSDAFVFFPAEVRRVSPELAGPVDSDEDEASLVAEPTALLSARIDPRTAARVGGRLRLAVD